jgi:two-component system, sensor histidine kinase RegB
VKVPAIGLAWLVQFRTVAFAVLAVVSLAITRWVDADAPLGLVMTLLSLAALSNARLSHWIDSHIGSGEGLARFDETRALLTVLVLDMMMITGWLLLLGGPGNPFSVVYLLYVAMGAVVLRGLLAHGLALLSAALFGSLFYLPSYALDPSAHLHHASSFHLRGMWFSYALAAFAVAYLVSKVSALLRAGQVQMRGLEQLAARHEKLASLTTLAAGAAHELATPLGSILMAAEALRDELPSGTLAEDAKTIVSQVERCRAILNRMAHRCGGVPGETAAACTLTLLKEQLLGELAAHRRGIAVEVATGHSDMELQVPLQGWLTAMTCLVQNAWEAQATQGPPVRVRLETSKEGFSSRVSDRGVGMSATLLARVGDPFFTSKATGMGLGVFLVRNFAAALQGALVFDSKEGQGTLATLTLPILVPHRQPPTALGET